MINDHDATAYSSSALKKLILFFGFHQSFVFLGPDTLFCRRTPFNTARFHLTGDSLVASLALNLRLIRPYLCNPVTPETGYLFGIWRSNLSASGTTIF